jgi:integrase
LRQTVPVHDGAGRRGILGRLRDLLLNGSGDGPTLRQAADIVVQRMLARGGSEWTESGYEMRFGRLFDLIDQTRLCRSVTADDVAKLVADRRRLHGVATNTVRDDLRLLHRLFVCAGEPQPNPVDAVDPPPHRRPVRHVLTLGDVARLVDRMRRDARPGAQFAADLVTLLAATGMRAYELGRLRGRDIQATSDGGAIVAVPGKVGGVRSVPVSRDLGAVALRLALAAGPDGIICCPSTLGTTLGRWSHRLGEPRLSGRVLRRSYATALARAGTPMQVVQRLLGHQSLTMTSRYLGVLPGDLEAAAEVVRRDLGGA